MLSQETLYQALHRQDWKTILTLLHKRKDEIAQDQMLSDAAGIFTNEFLRFASSYPVDRQDIVEYLEDLDVLHAGKFYILQSKDLDTLHVQLAMRKQITSLKEAVTYARKVPGNPVCQEIINRYEELGPVNVVHTQQNRIHVTHQTRIEDTDLTINLFKSNQEIELFTALSKVFDTYQIYPNVAISCLLYYEGLKTSLSNEERDFFFKGVVDFVVFDQAEGYKPVYFFELDSDFHDTEKQQTNDHLKNQIFAKAGVKLYRIRKLNRYVDDREFITMIRDLIKS
jgi:hypothetical protein